MAVAAGARRTASANDAILKAFRASEVTTSFSTEDPERVEEALNAVPGVSAAEVWVGFRGRSLSVDPGSITAVLGFWSDRPTVDVPIVTSGRFPTGDGEAFLNEPAALRSGLGVGSRLELVLADSAFQDFRPVQVEIVGIGLFPDGVIQDELATVSGIWLSRALTERHLDRQQFGIGLLGLSPEGVDTVAAGLAAVARGESTDGGMVIDEYRDEDRNRVREALQPLLWALTGLAGLAGGATVLVAAQALGRTLRRRRADDASLAAMGCTTRQLVATDLAYTAAVSASGIAVAVAVAVAASPLFPIGPPRRVDAVRGVDIDPVALGIGSLMLVVAMLALVGVGSWRRRAGQGPTNPGRAPGLLGDSPSSSTGLRLLTGRRGTMSMVAGVTAGLAAVFATLTFTGSLGRLVDDPAQVGMSWDVIAREGYTNIDISRVRDAVKGEPSVQRLSGITYLDGELNGVKLPIAEIRSVVGNAWPPIVAGRAPASNAEALVGSASLERLGLHIGDELAVSLVGSISDFSQRSQAVRMFTIVGSGVTPAIGLPGFDSPRLDVGVLLGEGAFQEMFGVTPGSDVLLFDLARGGKPSELIGRFPEGLPDELDVPTEWFTSAVPAEVSQARSAGQVTWLAVGALAVAIVATIAHTLLGFVRQRRRDYAVLKALGFTRRQVRATVLWQSGVVLAVSLGAALPLGVAGGRWLWAAYADGIGIVSQPVVPPLLLAAATALSILAVQGAALIPATIARRTPAGQTLHGE